MKINAEYLFGKFKHKINSRDENVSIGQGGANQMSDFKLDTKNFPKKVYPNVTSDNIKQQKTTYGTRINRKYFPFICYLKCFNFDPAGS